VLAAPQVCDGASQLGDAVVGAGGELQLAHGCAFLVFGDDAR